MSRMIREPIYVEEYTDDPALIAIDPGGTTGWCVMQICAEAVVDDDINILDNIIHWEQGQFAGSEREQYVALADLVNAWEDAAVVVEDFTLRMFNMNKELLSPVRITAALDYHLAMDYDPVRSMFLQTPEMAMTDCTDTRLRSWGMYIPGEEHARDAERHALTFLRRAKAKAKLRVSAWPQIYGKRVG